MNAIADVIQKLFPQMPPEIAEAVRTGAYQPRSYEESQRWQVEAYNSTIGGLQGYDCPECLNRGNIAKLKNGHLVIGDCRCMKIRRSLRNIERSGLSDLLDAYTFERYSTKREWQRSAKVKAQAFLTDNYGKWFCALGAVGSGKSHICTAICVEMLKAGKEVRYIPWRDTSVRLKALVNYADDYTDAIEALKRVEVLYIDDFFKTAPGEKPSEADIKLAHELLNARYVDRRRVTILSTEWSVNDLVNIDEALGSRIYERGGEDCLVEFTGGDKNQRLRK